MLRVAHNHQAMVGLSRLLRRVSGTASADGGHEQRARRRAPV